MTTQQERTRRVLDDVDRERASQIGRGFTEAHDDDHGIGELLALAPSYMQAQPGSWPVYTWDRARLVKAAALIVAAIETMDRAEASG